MDIIAIGNVAIGNSSNVAIHTYIIGNQWVQCLIFPDTPTPYPTNTLIPVHVAQNFEMTLGEFFLHITIMHNHYRKVSLINVVIKAYEYIIQIHIIITHNDYRKICIMIK